MEKTLTSTVVKDIVANDLDLTHCEQSADKVLVHITTTNSEQPSQGNSDVATSTVTVEVTDDVLKDNVTPNQEALTTVCSSSTGECMSKVDILTPLEIEAASSVTGKASTDGDKSTVSCGKDSTIQTVSSNITEDVVVSKYLDSNNSRGSNMPGSGLNQVPLVKSLNGILTNESHKLKESSSHIDSELVPNRTEEITTNTVKGMFKFMDQTIKAVIQADSVNDNVREQIASEISSSVQNTQSTKQEAVMNEMSKQEDRPVFVDDHSVEVAKYDPVTLHEKTSVGLGLQKNHIVKANMSQQKADELNEMGQSHARPRTRSETTRKSRNEGIAVPATSKTERKHRQNERHKNKTQLPKVFKK